MAEANQDFSIYRGQACRLRWSRAPAGSIAGRTITFLLKRALGSSAATILTRAVTVESESNGIFYTDLTTTETQALPRGEYFYDVWDLTSAGKEPLALGTITVRESARY